MSELFHSLGVNSTVIAAQITGFILLLLVMAKFLFGPVLGLLAAREQEIKAMYETAETERKRGEDYRAEYEQRVAGIEVEARARLQAAIKEGQDAKDEIVSDARSRAEDILRRGQEDLVREREKTLAQIREDVVNVSVAAAGKLIGESMDPSKHRSLVTDFIDRIGTSR